MEPDDKPLANQSSRSALQYARDVSLALREEARLVRFSKRSRRTAGQEGFQGRRRTALVRILAVLSFLLMVLVPAVLVTTYYAVYASDQYESEARFTVSGGMPVLPDKLTSLTGLPAKAVIQDTQIVTNYIRSRAAVEQLQEKINLRQLYSRDSIDVIARFDETKPIEKFVEYWKEMVSVSIKMPAGIVVVQVRAFSPRDAETVAQAVIDASEKLINDMDDRMNQDAVKNAESQVDSATARLSETRKALEIARNDSGILDANRSADAALGLITSARQALLQQQQDYQTQIQSVSPQAPQMKVLRSRIEASIAQINELEANVTKTAATGKKATLSVAMNKFADLELENKIAERLYAGALAELEGARLVAHNQMMYLTTFVKPTSPQDATYPHRILAPVFYGLFFLVLWGFFMGTLILFRNYVS